MISCTLSQYKEGYKTRLLTFLNEYEDNTKSSFLQNEKKKYQAYQKALTKIVDQMMFFTSEDLKNNNRVHKSIAADLKEINPQAYKAIITELVQITKNERLSLSTHKRDKIIIDEKELENHIKSSILILKFIADPNDISNDISKPNYTDELGETVMKQNTRGQLDVKLEKWLNNYEANFEYLPIPLIIEEKPDYVTDTYKNYEERYFKFQIDVCNVILRTLPNDKIIIEYKGNFGKKLIDLRKKYQIPSTNIETIISDINNAFFRLEKFMDGSVSIYQSFLFNDTFTLFFNELNKVDNINDRNFKWRDDYHNLLYHIDYAFDKSEFKNSDAYQNADFKRDCNEICYIHLYRAAEFGLSGNLDDHKFEMPSIVDIIKEQSNNSLALSPVVVNPPQVVIAPKKAIDKFIVSHENLVNDPLFQPDNEHIVLEKELKKEINGRLKNNNINDFDHLDDFDDDFKEWQKNQNLAIQQP